jgi:hypothetical protein
MDGYSSQDFKINSGPFFLLFRSPTLNRGALFFFLLLHHHGVDMKENENQKFLHQGVVLSLCFPLVLSLHKSGSTYLIYKQGEMQSEASIVLSRHSSK